MFRELLINRQLPPGYTKLNYLESSGQSIINTGFISDTGNHRFDFTFLLTANNNGRSLFATRQQGISPGVGRVGTAYFGSSNVLNLYVGNSSSIMSSPNLPINTVHTGSFIIKMTPNEASFIINNTVIGPRTWVGSSITPNVQMPIFGAKIDSNDFAERLSGRYYKFDITSYSDSTHTNIVKQYKFIPVLDNNSIPAMYDIVNKTTHYNVGAGSFTYG